MSETQDLNKQIAEELGYRPIAHYPDVYDTPYGDTHESALPNWAHSVDAALTLPIEGAICDWHWELRVYPTGEAEVYLCVRSGDRGIQVDHYGGDGDKLPEAICRAWLAYHKATKGGEK